MPQPLPAGYQKTYLSVAMSRAYSMDNPVGDPFGGPAYGEKNGPVAAIALPMLTMAGTYAAAGSFAAMTLMQGLTFAGAALSLAGTVSGNKTLSKIGMIAGVAGGVGMLAESVMGTTIGGTLGETFGGAGSAGSTASGAGLSQTPGSGVGSQTPVVEGQMVDAAAGPTADLTSASASYAGGNINAGPGSAAAGSINAGPGSVAAPLNAGPGAPIDQFGTAAGAPFDAMGNPTAATSQIALNSSPGPGATGVGAEAASKGFGSEFMQFANKNPMITMMGFQAVGGLSDYLSGKTDAEIDALQAQIGYADARAMQIQEQLALEKQRRANLNAGYQQVNTGINVNPNASIQLPWTPPPQPQQGLIAGNMPPRG